MADVQKIDSVWNERQYRDVVIHHDQMEIATSDDLIAFSIPSSSGNVVLTRIEAAEIYEQIGEFLQTNEIPSKHHP